MRGAHCLVCCAAGPDLVITDAAAVAAAALQNPRASLADLAPVDGMVALLDFRCGSCGRRWAWRARRVEGAWVYTVVATATPEARRPTASPSLN